MWYPKSGRLSVEQMMFFSESGGLEGLHQIMWLILEASEAIQSALSFRPTQSTLRSTRSTLESILESILRSPLQSPPWSTLRSILQSTLRSPFWLGRRSFLPPKYWPAVPLKAACQTLQAAFQALQALQLTLQSTFQSILRSVLQVPQGFAQVSQPLYPQPPYQGGPREVEVQHNALNELEALEVCDHQFQTPRDLNTLSTTYPRWIHSPLLKLAHA